MDDDTWPDLRGPSPRQVARDIQARHPGWMVLHGPYSRRIWAFLMWPGYEGGWLSEDERYPDFLMKRMRTVELRILSG